jgi:hypothetical protein
VAALPFHILLNDHHPAHFCCARGELHRSLVEMPGHGSGQSLAGKGRCCCSCQGTSDRERAEKAENGRNLHVSFPNQMYRTGCILGLCAIKTTSG